MAPFAYLMVSENGSKRTAVAAYAGSTIRQTRLQRARAQLLGPENPKRLESDCHVNNSYEKNQLKPREHLPSAMARFRAPSPPLAAEAIISARCAGTPVSVFCESWRSSAAAVSRSKSESSSMLSDTLLFPTASVVFWPAISVLSRYERIDAEADNDEEYAKLLESIMGATAHPPVDQFYRVIQSH
jgi:hypothetical protein